MEESVNNGDVKEDNLLKEEANVKEISTNEENDNIDQVKQIEEVVGDNDDVKYDKTIDEELLEEQLLENVKQDEINAERNKGPHLYRESKTSIDDGTFAVFNRFRDKTQLPLQKMVGKTIYEGLHKLVKDGKIKKIKKLLGKVAHSSVDIRTEKEFYNRTPLHLACICGNLEVVQLLLGHKANKNLKDNWGWTPIMYAGSYGHVEIVKELIGRGANIALKNKKDQFLIDIVRAKRDEFEWRDDLATFIEKTEDDLTSQIFADGLKTSFGRILHFTRPIPRYRDATLTLPLNEVQTYLEHRNGDFGFKHCKRIYSVNQISKAQILPESKDTIIEFNLEKCLKEEVFQQDRPQEMIKHLNIDHDKISKTDLNQVINIHANVPNNLHASWMVRYLKKRVETYETDLVLFEENRRKAASKGKFKMFNKMKNTFTFANKLKKKSKYDKK